MNFRKKIDKFKNFRAIWTFTQNSGNSGNISQFPILMYIEIGRLQKVTEVTFLFDKSYFVLYILYTCISLSLHWCELFLDA